MGGGTIIKALSGFYDVLLQDGSQVIRCRARGVFKNRGVNPLVGDDVYITHHSDQEGTITEVLPRRSELIRPPVANVDLALLVFSLVEPALNLHLMDKFLAHIEYANLNAAIVFTKQDLLVAQRKDDFDPTELDKIVSMYEEIGYPVFVTDVTEQEAVQQLQQLLSNHMTVFAGQSGVGKSTLINRLVPGLQLQTGAISMKLGRGKHTTRHVELLPLPQGGTVVDTPGFSQLDFDGWEAEQLSGCFREVSKVAAHCKFRECLHQSEPQCKVIEAVHDGHIAASRYEHYLSFLQQIREQKRRY